MYAYSNARIGLDGIASDRMWRVRKRCNGKERERNGTKRTEWECSRGGEGGGGGGRGRDAEDVECPHCGNELREERRGDGRGECARTDM